MKRLLLLLSFALLGGLGFGQGFDIRHFHADITLRLDGSFLVEERIEVDFSEQKHGIFRAIPFKYTTLATGATLAKDRVVGSTYTTYLDSLEVEGQEFKVSEEGDYKKLRIGSADTYVSGPQTYRLSYVVYGAINRFYDHDELYWNVNGTEWPASADKVSVRVILPNGKLKLNANQCKLFTGKAGETGTDASMEVEPGAFSARSTRKFEANEGLTIGLWLPSNLLKHKALPLRVRAKHYLFDSIHTTATFNANGSITVEEYLVVDLIDQTTELKRWSPSIYGIRGPDGSLLEDQRQGRIQLHEAVRLMPDGYVSNRFPSVENVPQPTITLGDMDAKDGGRQLFRLKYTYWETSSLIQGDMVYALPWLGSYSDEPVRTARIDLRWPAGLAPAPSGVAAMSALVPNVVSKVDAQGAQAALTQPLFPGDGIFWSVRLRGPGLKPITPPMRLTGDGTYHHLVDVTIKIEPSGKLHIKELTYQSADGRRSYAMERPVRVHSETWEEVTYEMRAPTLFGNRGEFLYGGLACTQACEQLGYGYSGANISLPIPFEVQPKDSAVVGYEYWLYGLLKRDGDAYLLHFPLVSKFEEPVEGVQFRVELPGKPALSAKDYQLSLSGSASPYPIESRADYKDGLLYGSTSGLVSGQNLDLRIRIPAAGFSTSYWLEFRLLFHNQFFLCVCLLLSVLVAVMWFWKGRDKRLTIVPAFLPPADLTPAEAGLLFDGHLHDRDILSLIYYWGAKGLLRIEEVEVNGGVADYHLHKLKALPKSAMDYEKTIFNALFDKKDVVSVSSLKQKFYMHMSTARTQIEAHATKKGYFVPGTVAFSRLLLWLGILVLVPLLLWFLAGLLQIVGDVWQTADVMLGFGVLGATMFGFSFVMTKHGPFGRKRYEELMGFHEFLDKAERDRLRLLQDEDPDYFGLTLSYAIGMGMANRWVEKFGPLLTVAPTYYQSASNRGTFNAVVFNTLMSKQLQAMSTNFTSSPPPPPGSGGGSSWGGGSSGGSSYRSSSSYSGGGSSYSSGGSSGGGYGGGGGGSW